MMVFRKKMDSKGNPIVLGDSQVEKLFPPGFCYKLGSIIYTVKDDVTQESAAPMREVTCSDGATEIIPVETIMKDLKEPDCEVMEMDKRFARIEEPVVEVKKKKKTKKKKKKTKKSMSKKGYK